MVKKIKNSLMLGISNRSDTNVKNPQVIEKKETTKEEMKRIFFVDRASV